MQVNTLTRSIVTALLCGVAMLSGSASAQRREGVDLELVLAVDVSGSMDPEEQQLQREGYVQAFRHGAVLSAIRSGIYGRIAVTYVQWAALPQQTIPWTIISNAKEAQDFAAALEAAPLYSERGTSLSSAISFSTDLLENNPISARKVIDISGDGPNNSGGSVLEARDAALAKGITINGIPILVNTQYSYTPLDQYYRECVVAGKGAFVIPVKTMDAFASSIRAKLVTEIAGLAPEQSPYAAKFQLAQAAQTRRADCNERGGFQP
jgi:hypothetical protein